MRSRSDENQFLHKNLGIDVLVLQLLSDRARRSYFQFSFSYGRPDPSDLALRSAHAWHLQSAADARVRETKCELASLCTRKFSGEKVIETDSKVVPVWIRWSLSTE